MFQVNVDLNALDIGDVDVNAIVVGFNFTVCDGPLVCDWASNAACNDNTNVALAFNPGDDIPVVVDEDGIFGIPGGQIGSGSPSTEPDITNGDNEPIFCGDRVKLMKVTEGGSGATDTWKAYKV